VAIQIAVGASGDEFVALADHREASDLLGSVKRARQRKDLVAAMEILGRGSATFPHIRDVFGHPVFAKETIRLLLAQNDVAGAEQARQRLAARYGPFHWDDILFARHYTAAGLVADAIEKWRAVLARGPSPNARSEALAAIAALERRASIDQRLQAYFFDGGYNKVIGVCDGETLHRIHQFHQLHVERGVVGDLFEIGVYHGRLFIMLALLARAEECAVAIDVFDIGAKHDPYGGVTTLEIVKANYGKFVDDPAKFSYIAQDSLMLTPEAVRKNW